MNFYNKACIISPGSIFVRERRAGIFLKKGDVRSSLVQLTILRDLAPSRADIHIMLGRSYAANGEKNLALQSFTVALALDPAVSRPILYFLHLDHFPKSLIVLTLFYRLVL